MMKRALAIAILLGVPPARAEQSFDAGAADRAAWESWFGALGVEGKEGAAFWAEQRSKPNPLPCDGQANKSEYWLKGCNEARTRLAASDVQRKADSQYRRGWNSYQSMVAEGAPATTASSAPTPSPTAAIPPSLPPAKPWEPSPGDLRVSIAAQDCSPFRIRYPRAYGIPTDRGATQCEEDKRRAQASLDTDKRRYDDEQREARQRREAERQTAMEQSPRNLCRVPEVAALVLRNANELFHERGWEVIDIEHITMLPPDPANSAFGCRGVFVMSNGVRVSGTLTGRQNVANQPIIVFHPE